MLPGMKEQQDKEGDIQLSSSEVDEGRQNLRVGR
jgi:hypothetical protein